MALSGNGKWQREKRVVEPDLGIMRAGFAERLLEVIDAGRRTATYKLALLLALVDLCSRQSGEDGRAPSILYTRDIAEQVAAIYWPQVIAYRPPDAADAPLAADAVVLNQISAPRATIVLAVRRFREQAEAAGATSLQLARLRRPGEYEEMIDRVEVTVATQPLPRLQTVGTAEANFPFLYDLSWGPRAHFSIARLRAAGARGLEVMLRAGAGDELVRLAPLIRPLIEVHWTRMVAQFNEIAKQEEDLHRHLFGSARPRPPAPMRQGIAELQAGRCFYCRDRFGGRPQADHFIPRVRCGIDAIENLVLADKDCNGDKRDLLPAAPLVARWADRNADHRDVLAGLGRDNNWDTDGAGTHAVARSIYRHLPAGVTPVWVGRGLVEGADPAAALAALAASAKATRSALADRG